MKKPLVVIPARGGSKRFPGKNIKPLNGKPLIHYTIEAAREVFEDAIICVSTDDAEIKKVAEQTGLNVRYGYGRFREENSCKTSILYFPEKQQRFFGEINELSLWILIRRLIEVFVGIK